MLRQSFRPRTDLAMRGHDDGRAEGPEFKSQIEARWSAEDEKIVALILRTHKSPHMHNATGSQSGHMTTMLFLRTAK